MAAPSRNALRAPLALPLALLLGCGAPEGRRPAPPVPAGWHHWSEQQLEFDCPPGWKVTARPPGVDSLDLLIVAPEEGRERCILALHFGPEPRFPSMACMKPFARRACDTRIGGARARRIDPPELPGSSEGKLELGGPGPFHVAHFRYTGLDPASRQAVEQLLASLRNRPPKP